MSDLDDISDHKYLKRIVVVIVVNSTTTFLFNFVSGKRTVHVLFDPRTFKGIHCGRPNCLPWSDIFDTTNGKVIPQSIPFIPGRDTWNKVTTKTNICLSSCESYLVCTVKMCSLLIFWMCTHTQKWYFYALPLLALPPLESYLRINHTSFTSVKIYILFLFKAQTMSEEVRWVKVLCCLKLVHSWPVPQWKPFLV